MKAIQRLTARRRQGKESSLNPLLAVMRYYGAPETRDEFLALRYMGTVPAEISTEEEALFPEKFQRAALDMPVTNLIQ